MYGGNKNTVKEAWSDIIQNLLEIRKKYSNLNGLELWESIKPFLSEIDNRKNVEIFYNPEHIKIKQEFNEKFKKQIPEIDLEGKLIERNHFLLQLINIPYKDNNKVTFRRFMQIALNIGQYNEFNNIKYFPQDILNFVKVNQLYDINTYMTPNNYNKFVFTDADLTKLKNILNKLRKNPPLIQKGGGFIKRYLIVY